MAIQTGRYPGALRGSSSTAQGTTRGAQERCAVRETGIMICFGPHGVNEKILYRCGDGTGRACDLHGTRALFLCPTIIPCPTYPALKVCTRRADKYRTSFPQG